MNTAPTTYELYTIDNVVPTVSITRDDPNPSHATSFVFSVDFSEDVTSVDAAADDFHDELRGNNSMKYAAGTIAVTSPAMSAGYLSWTNKGGFLVASLVSSLPTWQTMDPLPIYDSMPSGYFDDEEDDEFI